MELWFSAVKYLELSPGPEVFQKEKKTKLNNSGKYQELLQIAHYGKAGSRKNV